MDNQTETASAPDTVPPTRKQFDHEAIRADLEGGMSAKDTASAHGCSLSLVQTIRRRSKEGDERTPRNVRRAVQLRKKAEQLSTEVDMLNKWLANESSIATENGEPYTGVTDLIAEIETVRTTLDVAAEMFEALPEDVMKTKRAPTRVEFEVGMVVKAKEKFLETYQAICSSPEHLTVQGRRDTHVLVEDDSGSRFFVPGKELEVRTDA